MPAVDMKGAGGLDDFKRDWPAPTRASMEKAERVRAAFDARKPQASGGGRELTSPELPPSPDELNGLSVKIDLRVSPEEKARWYEYAAAQGMSAAELIRSTVNARVA